MDAVKRISKNLKIWVLLLYLGLFPFGQLLGFSVNIFGYEVFVHPQDLVVGLSVPFFLFSGLKRPKVYRYILSFIIISGFSLILSVLNFPFREVVRGFLYLLRFFAYSTFLILVWNIITAFKKTPRPKLRSCWRGDELNADISSSFRGNPALQSREDVIKDNIVKKDSILKLLISICVLIAVLGWIQYLWFPDLRDLKFIGWDDHLYRLASTFLDPAFTAILLVLGALVTLTYVISSGNKKLITLVLFFFLTILFTYSRAAYISLIGGVFTTFLLLKKRKIILWLALIFLLVIPILPRPGSEGVKLERLHSVFAKLTNYRETVEIIKRYPVFGVGFNNICSARTRMFADSFQSHSCYGADSSLLFVAATTGILGFFVFLNLGFQVLTSIRRNIYGISFIATSSALIINSLFVNSLFYPWVMGYMVILLALSLKE